MKKKSSFLLPERNAVSRLLILKKYLLSVEKAILCKMRYFERSANKETRSYQSLKCKVSKVEGEEKIKQKKKCDCLRRVFINDHDGHQIIVLSLWQPRQLPSLVFAKFRRIFGRNRG